MSYLIDTNVLFELRKAKRCDPRVATWYRSAGGEEKFVSVLTMGEIRRGIESIRRRDPRSARTLDGWLAKLRAEFASRILLVNEDVAEAWGRLMVPDPLPVVDSILAATAIVHGLTLVTRNVANVEPTGVAWINPFEYGG